MIQKGVTYLCLMLLFFFLFFLQSNFFSWFTIAGVKPNIYIIYLLFIGVFIGRGTGLVFGALSGLYLDFLFGRVIGIYAVLFALCGFLPGLLERKFSKESKMTFLLMCMGLTFLCELALYCIYFFASGNLEIISFLKIVAIELLYNTILVIIIYPIIKKSGELCSEIFQKSNILTKYY